MKESTQCACAKTKVTRVINVSAFFCCAECVIIKLLSRLAWGKQGQKYFSTCAIGRYESLPVIAVIFFSPSVSTVFWRQEQVPNKTGYVRSIQIGGVVAEPNYTCGVVDGTTCSF